MDKALLVAASACFAAGLLASLRGLWMRSGGAGMGNLWAMGAGFLLLTASLYVRGQVEGSCPLNNLYDVLVFLAWAVVLVHLVIGPAYRLSLLGTFTSPLALTLLLVAMLAPLDRTPVPRPAPNAWIETHAALSLIAYGCFALACIAGAMYLVQERHLKTRRFTPFSRDMPPIADLATANRRLVAFGLALLTAGFLAGLLSGEPVHTVKWYGSLGIWMAYGCLWIAARFAIGSHRRIAAASVAVFAVVLATLPVIQHLSRPQ
jgi:ABC-type uncharacterized transport system permease subunit